MPRAEDIDRKSDGQMPLVPSEVAQNKPLTFVFSYFDIVVVEMGPITDDKSLRGRLGGLRRLKYSGRTAFIPLKN